MTDYPPLTEPASLPSGPMQSPAPVGDAQSDAARLSAMNARGALANRYNTDDMAFDNDIVSWNEANSNWERVKTNMDSAHRMSCYGYISTAYSHLGNERSFLQNAYTLCVAGDSYIDEGDALPANQSQQKTQKYMSASSAYASSDQKCASAESESISFHTALNSAWGIMNQYG